MHCWRPGMQDRAACKDVRTSILGSFCCMSAYMADNAMIYVWESAFASPKEFGKCSPMTVTKLPTNFCCACCTPYFGLTGQEWRANQKLLWGLRPFADTVVRAVHRPAVCWKGGC